VARLYIGRVISRHGGPHRRLRCTANASADAGRAGTAAAALHYAFHVHAPTWRAWKRLTRRLKEAAKVTVCLPSNFAV